MHKSQKRLITDCRNCCFLNIDPIGCKANQLCIADENGIWTPGACRLNRSKKWQIKQDIDDIDSLINIAMNESKLSFTLIVIWQDAKCGIEKIEENLRTESLKQYCDKIIIEYISDDRKHSKELRQFIDEKRQDFDIVADISLDDANPPQTIYRLAKRLVKTPYFMVVDAGDILLGLPVLNDHLQELMTRSIHWNFAEQYGGTLIFKRHTYKGLYMKSPYNYVAKYDEKTFVEQLEEFESKDNICLSCNSLDCAILSK